LAAVGTEGKVIASGTPLPGPIHMFRDNGPPSGGTILARPGKLVSYPGRWWN